MNANSVENSLRTNDWLPCSHTFHSNLASFQLASSTLDELWASSSDVISLNQLENLWLSYSPDRSTKFLIELIKIDQLHRLKLNDSVDLNFYTTHFPELKSDRARFVSLAYAEFCNHEFMGNKFSVDSFCQKYPEIDSSIRQQLAIHDMLSITSNELIGHDRARHFPRPGQIVEHFELDRELGRGGAARVFLARDLRLGRRLVALKISGDTSTEPEILARLEHDNIVPVLSVHDADAGLRLICMPYRGDTTLERLFNQLFLDKSNPPQSAHDFRSAFEKLSPDHDSNSQTDGPENGWIDFPNQGHFYHAVAWIGLKLAQALTHAHKQKILHRDIKPANILISRKSGPQLLDFNMARDPEALSQIEDRIRGGTLPYMSPEQLAAFLDSSIWSDIGEPADIFSLGLVLKELLTGKRVDVPLPTTSPVRDQVRALLRQRSEPWSNLRQLNPKIPHGLDAILKKTMAFRPVDRYQNAEQLAQDLDRFIHLKPLKWVHNPSIKERFIAHSRHLFKPAGIAATLLAIIYISLSANTSTPLPTIKGVNPATIQSILKKDYNSAAVDLAKPVAPELKNTKRDLLSVICRIHLDPSNPQIEEEFKQLLSRKDILESVSDLKSLLGNDPNLDLLPVLHDFNRLYQNLNKVPVDNIEWQNLERRFFQLHNNWPMDIRVLSYLAFISSMRQDPQNSLIMYDKALDVIKSQPGKINPIQIREAMENRFHILVMLGREQLEANAPEKAKAYFEKADTALQTLKLNYANLWDSAPKSTGLLLNEFATIAGLADALGLDNNADKAISQYRRASTFLDQNREKFSESDYTLRKNYLIEKLQELENRNKKPQSANDSKKVIAS